MGPAQHAYIIARCHVITSDCQDSTRVYVSFHLQESSQQLILEKLSHIVQLLTFQPIKGDNFWIVDHLCASLKAISLNELIIP